MLFLIVLLLAQQPESGKVDTLKLKKLYKIATRWGVGENKQKVPEARKKLASYKKAALDFIFKTNRIKTLKTLDLRAIRAVVKRNRCLAIPYIHEALNSQNDTIFRVALWLAGEIKDTSSLPIILDKLKRTKESRKLVRLINAFGKIGDTSEVGKIVPYLKDTSEIVKTEAACVLADFGMKRLKNEYFKMLRSSVFQMRFAGMRGLSKLMIFSELLDSLEAASSKDTLFKAELLKILSLSIYDTCKISKSERIKIRSTVLNGGFLKNKSPLLRGYAVELLGKLKTPGIKNRLEELKDKETDVFVRFKLKEALKN